MLANPGDIVVTATELRVTFTPPSSPHRIGSLAALNWTPSPALPGHPAARPLRSHSSEPDSLLAGRSGSLNSYITTA
jgi:hypothetical protein